MNRPRITILTLAAAMALAVWPGEAFVDSLVFTQKSFNELLLSPPTHTFYLRTFLSICFLLFGGFAASIAGRLKEAETLARNAENRLQTTLDSIGEAVIAMDTDGMIRRMNPRSEELTGWSLDEARNRHISDVLSLYNARTRSPCSDPAQKVLAEGNVQGLANHTLLRSKEGKEYHIADSASPIWEESGEISGVVLVMRDVSEEYTAGLLTQKRLEIVDYDASRSVEQMLTSALDEITELLESPVGFFHILTEDEDGPVQQHWSSATLRTFCRARKGSGHSPMDRAGVWADCLRERRPVAHNDFPSLARGTGLPEGHPELTRVLVVPVIRDNRVVAVLGAGNKPADYGEKDQEIAAFLADVTWGVIQRRQAEEKAYHLNRVLSALRRVNQLITTEKDRERLISGACTRLIESRGYHSSWIVLLDGRGGIAEYAEAGLSEKFPLFLDRLRDGELFSCLRKALHQQDVLIINDQASSCGNCPLADKHAGWATMSVRLEHEGAIHGVLSVSMDRSFARYTEEQSLFREVGADLAFALYSLDLEEENRLSVEALRESERQVSTLMANLPGMAYRCRNDETWTMDFVSQGCLQLTGYESTELVENRKTTYADIISEQDREQVRQIVDKAVREQTPFEMEYRITSAGGEKRHVWHKGVCVPHKDRGPSLEGFITDITDKKRAEDALRRQEEHVRAILQANPDPLIAYDHQGHPQYINPSFTRVFGWTFEELRGRQVPFVPQDEAERTWNEIHDIFRTGQPVQFDTKRLTKDGRVLDIRLSAALIPHTEEERQGLVVNLTDITERKRMEKDLEEMSLYDSLTGLYNRAFFEEEMRRLGSERDCSASIVVCDIDGLKLINDTLGHNKGDDLLRAAADVLRSCFRASDIAARIGGDEFAVLLHDTQEEAVRARCEKIHMEVAGCHQHNPGLGLSLSVGYSVARDVNEDMKTLFKRADDEMYKQKLQQKGNSRNETVQALITTMEARDNITDGHASRLADFAQKLGHSLGLSGERLNNLHLLARFHDLGKVGVPDSILFKPAPLTDEEFAEMKRHCEIGQRIALSTSDLAPIADFILKHHEWWNGQGYPLGLEGEEIPLESRILAIIDAYETITSNRPYKKAMPHGWALEELKRCSGTQFDPGLVEEFLRIMEAPEREPTTEHLD